MFVFADAGFDGKEWTYLTWDYIEMPGRYINLKKWEGKNTEFVEFVRLEIC